jgi:thymidylate synthase
LIKKILTEGEEITTRNSTVKRLIGQQVEFSTTPLVSIRKTAWKLALREWEWFLSGSSYINDLHPSVRHWWAPWADKDTGIVLNNYSKQFRWFSGTEVSASPGFDQIEFVIKTLREHPNSRRNILTTWHSAEMASAKTPITNCHNTLTQFFVEGGDKLTIDTNQRSVDVICGLPHNWIQMAAFQLWLAARVGLRIGRLIWKGGDCHVYYAHYDLANEMIERVDEIEGGRSPLLCYRPTTEDFRADDFYLEGDDYRPLITTKAEMIV